MSIDHGEYVKRADIFVDQGYLEAVTELAAIEEDQFINLPQNVIVEIFKIHERALLYTEQNSGRDEAQPALNTIGRIAALQSFGMVPTPADSLD